MLRSHEIFQQPFPVELNKSAEMEVPDAWKGEIKSGPISVLPLVDDLRKQYDDGWCTYTYEHVQAPELEPICGGVNSKTPRASGIWRQGHLMHFGFEPDPSQLNDNGRALLANSICYISRFGEDRPLVRTPSVFYSNVRLLDRSVIDRLIQNESRDLDLFLNAYLAEDVRELVRGMNRQDLGTWFKSTRGFLHADSRGKFKIDKEAQRFGISIDSPDFIPALAEALSETGDRNELARILCKRYVEIGPQEYSKDVWGPWWKENRDYLFFSDTGGFRWLIDSLAQQRRIPTTQLRGPARASREPVPVAVAK